MAITRITQNVIMNTTRSILLRQQRELLVRAHVDGANHEGDKVLASVRLHFRDPADGGLPRVQEAILRATITDDPALVRNHTNSRAGTLIAVREALTRLRERAPRLAQMVELRFFGGWTRAEIVRIQGIDRATVGRDWKKAKELLQGLLEGRESSRT